jgi:phage N-6-adenine-methyltransferase
MMPRFRGANHPQQVKSRGVREDIDSRATHWSTFRPLDKRFAFTIDVAASSTNTKCARFYTKEQNGLAQPWASERVWCNPPYSNIRQWLEKAWLEWHADPRPEVIVMLLPANRTEQGWWQDLVEPFRDRNNSPLRTEFIAGRIRFVRDGASAIFPNERPPFGCVLLIWDGSGAVVFGHPKLF